MQLQLGLSLLIILAAPRFATANLRAPRNSKLPPETWMSTRELLQHWNYPGETHTVQTDDGYIIDIHRIPGRRGEFDKRAGQRAKDPVIMFHGFCATSEAMILNPDTALALLLADADFDVWLANTRGNFYGRRNVKLHPKDPKFWDFSWHENGVHDMRSIIDYVTEVTGHGDVLIVGYSMGASSMYVLLSEMPEYNAKVRAAFLLAPPIFFDHMRGLFRQLKDRTPWLVRPIQTLTFENTLTRSPVPQVCFSPNGVVLNPGCMVVMADTVGSFYNMKNNTYMSLLMRHWPSGSSIRQFNHYSQLIIKGWGFRKFDFGPVRNRREYGTPFPPKYNITNVRCPTFFFYSENDYIVNEKDVTKLAAATPGTASIFKTPAKFFNHLDMMYEAVSADLVFKRLINQITKYRYRS